MSRRSSWRKSLREWPGARAMWSQPSSPSTDAAALCCWLWSANLRRRSYLASYTSVSLSVELFNGVCESSFPQPFHERHLLVPRSFTWSVGKKQIESACVASSRMRTSVSQKVTSKSNFVILEPNALRPLEHQIIHDKQSSSSHHHGPTRGREGNDIIKDCVGIQVASPLERRPPPYPHLPRHPHRPRGRTVHLGGSPGPRHNHGLPHPGLNLWD